MNELTLAYALCVGISARVQNTHTIAAITLELVMNRFHISLLKRVPRAIIPLKGVELNVEIRSPTEIEGVL